MEVEKRDLNKDEARRLVNSLQDLVQWEKDEAEEIEDPAVRAAVRRVVSEVEVLVSPFTK